MFLCHNKVRSIFDVNMTLSDFENLKCLQNDFKQVYDYEVILIRFKYYLKLLGRNFEPKFS